MPDLKGFNLTVLSAVNVNLQRVQIEGMLCDEQTGQPIPGQDYTGANALIFPGVLGQFTAAQRLRLAQKWSTDILLTKAGIEV